MLENETLSLPDIVEIMGERPFPMKESVVEYLKELKERKDVDEQLDAEEKKLQEALDEKKKQEADNLKFDINAEEKEEAAVKPEEEKKDSEEEKKQ